MLNQIFFVVIKDPEFSSVWHFGILGAFQWFHQNVDSTMLYCEVVKVLLSTTPCYDTLELDFFGVRCGQGRSRMRILISPRFLRLTSAHPNIPPESQCISEHLHTLPFFPKCALSVPLLGSVPEKSDTFALCTIAKVFFTVGVKNLCTISKCVNVWFRSFYNLVQDENIIECGPSATMCLISNL